MLVLGAEQQESELGDWREGYVENLGLESNSAASVIGVLTSCDSLTHTISDIAWVEHRCRRHRVLPR